MSPQPVPAAPRPPLRVALAGIGVVGGGVVRLLEANRDLIARRAGRAVEIVAISAQEAEYDGTLPVRRFAELCAGKAIVNASDGECGARVTETLDALYRSAASGRLERIGG